MASKTPTIHVTNWSSRKMHGPGRAWSIMVRPRRWELGDGFVRVFRPNAEMLDAVREGEITVDQYRDVFLIGYSEPLFGGPPSYALLRQGWLRADVLGGQELVRDGDTLCCACSRDAAAEGKCHRVWAAELLRRAGWRVLLDGREVVGVTEALAPVWAEAA